MTKDIKQDAQVDLNQTVTVSAADLLQLFNTIQENAARQSKEQNQALIEGLKQLSPSYVTPGQEENAINLRATMRKQQIDLKRSKLRQQKNCKHAVGQAGRKLNGEGAFAGLKLCTGETIGVCFYCHKVISSANPEHQKFFQQINGTVAESGQITGIMDSEKAQLARLGEDERNHVLELRRQYMARNPETEEEEDLVVF